MPKPIPPLMQTSKAAEKAPAPAGPAPEIRWYRVTSPDKNVVRQHGDFVLKRGKEINGADFDIQKLRNVGVTLEEIETPGWFMEQQQIGREKAIELARLRGEDLDVPEYVAPVVKRAEPAPAAPSA